MKLLAPAIATGARLHTVLAMMVLLVFFVVAPGCVPSDQARIKAKRGMLDLRHWRFEQDGPIHLAGEYEFYWQSHVQPERFAQRPAPDPTCYLDVHGSWNGSQCADRELGGHGFATYRLTVLLAQPRALALKFLDMGTAYRLYLNGEKVLAVGRAGTTAGETEPHYLPQVVAFDAASDTLEVIYHVSNFHHRRGGAWEAIQLGTPEQMYGAREHRLLFDMVLFGALVMIGLYHLALFALRKRMRSDFWLGVFCLLVSVRILTVVERYLIRLFPDMDWQLFVKIEYLSYYLAVPVFALFIYSLFGKDFHKIALRVMLATGLVFSVFVLITPVRLFSHSVPYYVIFTLLCLVYGTGVLLRAALNKRDGALITIAGYLIFFITVVNDVLDVNEIVQTGHFAHLGLFVFVFCQSFLVSFRYTKAFATIDLQREELQKRIEERDQAEKEKRALRERLARSQKMEAIGQLAGGIAHDLNNILSGTVTYPDLLLLDLPENSRLRRPLEIIRDSGLRAAAVVQDLLTLARRGVMQPEPLNLNQIVREYVDSPEHERLILEHPSINVEVDLASDLYNIIGSPVHLKKTLMNLVSNSAEAQPTGGDITISTNNRYVDRRLNLYEEVKEGNYAVLSVSDAGAGIPEQDMEKIFEPFYTSKVMGRSGSGLGLAVVWGTVHDHQGRIDIDSKAGRGTRFDLYFPITIEEIHKRPPSPPLAQYLGHGETILVVDDVAEQRQIAVHLLRRLGYNASACKSGEEAIEYVKRHHVNLLLLDMIMEPGLDGLETYQRIIALQPGMKSILASGFSETERVREARRLGAGRYLKKPYTLERLGQAVRLELHGS